ncbi:MAG: RsmB/NOP family class I SAM-dependent RNA methyltransferase [Candidatus Nanoarchaeia archaeon]|nr:RsmB/NOP family class I SAM-dependent RNA methyltransferase [Candidatus Nanoarchaeia archaeon]MDD5740459.1 RsmB/NOP family class I SAM-dependent RNA methyltransferase [Candidatus Nanoarchaeia archaeon]
MKTNYEPKPAFVERISKLLNDNKEDIKVFFESAKTQPKKAFRCNTIKISPEELIKRLEEKGWKISQPLPGQKEIMIIESSLQPGESGKTKEHLLGYYYIQEITSMMPVIALNLDKNDIFLDCCAAPGSKTTQAAALMENKGIIIANDLSIGRISILSANLERQGITNTIITRHDFLQLSKKLKELNMKFNKILVDAPCSGEGNIRLSPSTYLNWSEGLLNKLSGKQKRIAEAAFQLLEENGEMVYSTCSYAPEENEEVIQHLLNTYKDKIKIETIKLPIKSRPGITKWKNKKFSEEIQKACRIYHHDNDMEGFFVCKIKKLK